MLHTITRCSVLIACAACCGGWVSGLALGQGLPPEIEAEGVQALTRGPLHEAFASPTLADPQATFVVPKRPPADIDEIPPEYKPEGDDVQWIPGYWAFDDETKDYLWVSGVWRDPPPGKRWVPGYWTDAGTGFQWVPGFWVGEETTTFDYYEAPPQSIDQGPTTASPGDDYFWIPGVWVHSDTQYRWRPGYWHEHQADWVWVPARWVWTPRGCIYIPGCWDRTVAVRGQCFAPVAFSANVLARPDFSYSPRLAINVSNLFVHLWVRPSYGHYYYGNYYGDAYNSWNITPWCSYNSRPRCYDPLLTWNSVQYGRGGVNYVSRMQSWHTYYDRHVDYRPPRTYREQLQVVNNITNINVNNSNNVNINILQQNLLAQDQATLFKAPAKSDRYADLRLRQLEMRQRQEELIAAKSVKTFHDWRREEEKAPLVAGKLPTAPGGVKIGGINPGINPGNTPGLNPDSREQPGRKQLGVSQLPESVRVPPRTRAPPENAGDAGVTGIKLPGGVKVNELGRPTAGVTGIRPNNPPQPPAETLSAREQALQDLRDRQQKARDAVQDQLRGKTQPAGTPTTDLGKPPVARETFRPNTDSPLKESAPKIGGQPLGNRPPENLGSPKPNGGNSSVEDRLRELRERQQRAAEASQDQLRKAQDAQKQRLDDLKRQQQELLDRSKRSAPQPSTPKVNTQPAFKPQTDSTPRFQPPANQGGGIKAPASREAAPQPRIVAPQPKFVAPQPKVAAPQTAPRVETARPPVRSPKPAGGNDNQGARGDNPGKRDR